MTFFVVERKTSTLKNLIADSKPFDEFLLKIVLQRESLHRWHAEGQWRIWVVRAKGSPNQLLIVYP